MTRRKPKTLDIGSISEATLRTEDILPAWIYALEGVRLSREDRKTLEEIRKRADAEDVDEEGASYYDGESCMWDLESLQDMADRYVPPFCYAGSHEGDGASIGVWISQDALDEAIHDGEVLREHDALTTDARYRLIVSDHGNMTLRYVNGREVWSIV